MPTGKHRKSRRLSLANIARVHSRRLSVGKKTIHRHRARPSSNGLRKAKRLTRRYFGKTARINPQPPRHLFYIHTRTRLGSKWQYYAACVTMEQAKRVAEAVAKADRVQVAVTNSIRSPSDVDTAF